jgi:hypothetical protein
VLPVRPCACCGYLTVFQEYDICPVCFWEADDVQEHDPAFAGGANKMSLTEARASYRDIGAIGPGWLSHVRPPLPYELPAPAGPMRSFDRDWQQLEASRPWFLDRGYRLTDARGPEGMEQGLNAYEGVWLSIRLSADRGQWFVEISPGTGAPVASGSVGWYSLEAWSKCLGSPVLFHDTRPRSTEADWTEVVANSWWLEPQLNYLRDHLAEIERACSPERVDTTRECLISARG